MNLVNQNPSIQSVPAAFQFATFLTGTLGEPKCISVSTPSMIPHHSFFKYIKQINCAVSAPIFGFRKVFAAGCLFFFKFSSFTYWWNLLKLFRNVLFCLYYSISFESLFFSKYFLFISFSWSPCFLYSYCLLSVISLCVFFAKVFLLVFVVSLFVLPVSLPIVGFMLIFRRYYVGCVGYVGVRYLTPYFGYIILPPRCLVGERPKKVPKELYKRKDSNR